MAQLRIGHSPASGPVRRLQPSRRRLVVFSPGHDEVGGAARRSRLLAASLASRGWRVRVITRAGTRSRLAVRRSANLLVVELPGFGSRRLGAALFLAVGVPLGVVFGARSPVFLAIQLVSPTTAAALCAALLRRPFVAMATTSGQLSEAAFIMGGRLSALRRPLVRRAAYLAGQTEHVATELMSLVDRERIVVVPNPVQAVADAPRLTGAPRAVYTGRLSEEKDLSRLLEAWRVVAERRPEAILTLVGDGGRHRPVEHELRLAAQADAVLRETVRFTGWVPDVGPFLASSDVYVLPSLTEGMSNSLLEACAWGRVVVASNIPANVEVLGDRYPLLFAPGDTDSLIDALRLALDDENVRRDALERIAGRMSAYSIENVVAKLEATLESAVLGPAPP